MSSQQPSYQELLETCEELRKTAARAIGIKQELIETKEALDSELGRYRQLQRYVERALPLDTLSDFSTLTAETLVEFYDLEAALLVLHESGPGDGSIQARVLGSCGITSCPDTLPLPPEWLAATRATLFQSGSSVVAAWASLAARDVLMLPLQDHKGRVQGALVALRTVSGADFYPELPAAGQSSIGVLAQQASALLRNLQATQVIRQQLLELREALRVNEYESARRIAEEQQRLRQDAVIAAQRQTLRQLGTPMIPIRSGVLVIPVIGEVDHERAHLLLETVLTGVAERRAKLLIVDVTGLPSVDGEVASLLLRMTHAVKLLGAEVLLSGIRAEVAQRLIQLDMNLSSIKTTASLQSAIASSFATK